MKLWAILKTVSVLPEKVNVELIGPFPNYTEAQRAVISFPTDTVIDNYLIFDLEQLVTLSEKITDILED